MNKLPDIFDSLKTFACDVEPIPWGGGMPGELNSFYGMHHTEESKNKMVMTRIANGDGDYFQNKPNPFSSEKVKKMVSERMKKNNPMNNVEVKNAMRLRKINSLGFSTLNNMLKYIDVRLKEGKSLTRIAKELNTDKGLVIEIWRKSQCQQ